MTVGQLSAVKQVITLYMTVRLLDNSRSTVSCVTGNSTSLSDSQTVGQQLDNSRLCDSDVLLLVTQLTVDRLLSNSLRV